VQSGPDMVTMGKLPQTPRAKKVIELSMEEARALTHNYVGTEHILLGLLREQEGVAAQVLMNLGISAETVRAEVLNLLGHGIERQDRTDRIDFLQREKEKAVENQNFEEAAKIREVIDVLKRTSEVKRKKAIQLIARLAVDCLCERMGSDTTLQAIEQLIADIKNE
jgi:ATP-dependent Clp protease ATP-binding subunit ClpC